MRALPLSCATGCFNGGEIAQLGRSRWCRFIIGEVGEKWVFIPVCVSLGAILSELAYTMTKAGHPDKTNYVKSTVDEDVNGRLAVVVSDLHRGREGSTSLHLG